MRTILAGSTLLAAAALAAAVYAAPPATAARRANPDAAADTARLREALAAALGDDFEIVRTELSAGLRERSGTFWLVHARPLRSGDFRLTYRYEYRDFARPHDPLYTHVEHRSNVRVGEHGCWRRREGKDACLGDVVILPFVAGPFAGERYTGHTFALSRPWPSRPPAAPEGPAPARPGADTVANPASAHLRYLGSQAHESPHRNGGSTFSYHAEFEAVGPGRFNLALHPLSPGEARTRSSPGSIPVAVVARGEPVTVLLGKEEVRSYHETKGFASHTGNEYLTTVLLLQPGDRISLRYGGFSTRPRHGEPPLAPAARPGRGPLSPDPPTLGLLPFAVDEDEGFNAWIVEHLSADGSRR